MFLRFLFALCLWGSVPVLAAESEAHGLCEGNFVSLPAETRAQIDPEISGLLLDFLSVLFQKVDLTQMALGWGNSRLATERFNLESALAREVRETLIPALQNHIDAMEIARTSHGDREMMAFASAEAEQTSRLIRQHAQALMLRLTEMMFRRGDVAIVEIGRPSDTQLSAWAIEETARMYQNFARRRGWKVEALNESYEDRESGSALRFIALRISGNGGSSPLTELQFESGVHRFVRIGAGRSGEVLSAANRNRTHTNYSLVRIYGEYVPPTFVLDEREIELKAIGASGPGGQHVNNTKSAVQATHRPSGIQVTVQSERSQHVNRVRALQMLRARIYDQHLQDTQAQMRAERDAALVSQFEESDRFVRHYEFHRNSIPVVRWLGGDIEEQLSQRRIEALRRRLPLLTRELELQVELLRAEPR